MTPISELIEAIDAAWMPLAKGKQPLHIIDSTALMLQTNHARGTKDSDILESLQLDKPTQAQLISLGGKGSDLHKRHRMYVEIVGSGLPMLPPSPKWVTATVLNKQLSHFSLELLDPTDVVVSKLKRFHADDRRDIDAMIEGGHVHHEHLLERFKLAVDSYSMDARARELPKCVQHLNVVERDMFDVPESDIELPSWIDQG